MAFPKQTNIFLDGQMMFFGEMAGGHGENSGPGPSFSFIETVKRSLWGIWRGRWPERGWA